MNFSLDVASLFVQACTETLFIHVQGLLSGGSLFWSTCSIFFVEHVATGVKPVVLTRSSYANLPCTHTCWNEVMYVLITFLFRCLCCCPSYVTVSSMTCFGLGLFKSLHVLHLKVLMRFVSWVNLCSGLSFLLPCHDCFWFSPCVPSKENVSSRMNLSYFRTWSNE